MGGREAAWREGGTGGERDAAMEPQGAAHACATPAHASPASVPPPTPAPHPVVSERDTQRATHACAPAPRTRRRAPTQRALGPSRSAGAVAEHPPPRTAGVAEARGEQARDSGRGRVRDAMRRRSATTRTGTLAPPSERPREPIATHNLSQREWARSDYLSLPFLRENQESQERERNQGGLSAPPLREGESERISVGVP